MNKLLTLIFLITISATTLLGQNKVRVYGHVSDFDNQALDSVTVRLKQNIDSLSIDDKAKLFQNSYETLTDSTGYFSMEVDPGTYYCIYAIKESDYGKTRLEYWAWNVPIYHDLEINPQYHRMEVYGINGFEPQHGPFNSYMLYFRPMSLTEAHKIPLGNQPDTINIAPERITKDELTVKVNGRRADISAINKISISTRNNHYMYAYMVQIGKPDTDLTGFNSSQLVDGYDKITIELHSNETDEYGKGEYFLKKIGH